MGWQKGMPTVREQRKGVINPSKHKGLSVGLGDLVRDSSLDVCRLLRGVSLWLRLECGSRNKKRVLLSELRKQTCLDLVNYRI